MPPYQKRAVANVRERKRTKKLNEAFIQLGSIIPKEPSDKMSKKNTLELALAYIKFLNEILKEDGETQCPTVNYSSYNLDQSPCTSSIGSSSYYHTAASTSGDDDDYQHQNKRQKVIHSANQQEHSRYNLSPVTYGATNGNQQHYKHNLAQQSQPTIYTTTSRIPDEKTLRLRTAFSEYRSICQFGRRSQDLQ